jgi:hypothetical protein
VREDLAHVLEQRGDVHRFGPQVGPPREGEERRVTDAPRRAASAIMRARRRTR